MRSARGGHLQEGGGVVVGLANANPRHCGASVTGATSKLDESRNPRS